MGVSGPRAVPSAQCGIPLLALQARRSGAWLTVQLGEGLRQPVQRAAQDVHVVRMPQVGGQGGLGRLVLQVAPQMGAAHTAPQATGWPESPSPKRSR